MHVPVHVLEVCQVPLLSYILDPPDNRGREGGREREEGSGEEYREV